MRSWETVRKCDSRVVVGALLPGGGEKREAVFVVGVDRWWIVKEKEDGRRDSRRAAIAEGASDEAGDEGTGNGNDWDGTGEAIVTERDGRFSRRG